MTIDLAAAASLGPLLVVTLVTAAVPGPGIFYVMRAGAKYGRLAAFRAALGTTLACILMITATAVGATQLFQKAPALYDFLRAGGGVYLIWFGINLWFDASEISIDDAPRKFGTPFLQATLIGLTNPKGILYFASILAPYLAPGKPIDFRLATAGLVSLTCFGWYGTVGLAFSIERVANEYLRHSRGLDRVAGVLIGAFGIMLCTSLW